MTPEKQGRQAAEMFRKEHHLGTQPLGDLVTIIEQTLSHDVAVLDADPDEHGLTMRDPKRNVVFIGVARTPHPMRQRSSLAHETSHAIFEDWFTGDDHDLAARRSEEQRADAFARHLLIPQDGLAEFLTTRIKPLSEADLSAVVQHFLVSPQVAAIALHEGGYIDASTKKEWMSVHTPRLATRFGWLDHYRMLQADSNQTRVPQRLLARAISGYEAGVVSIQTIATLRGVPSETVIQEFEAAGITAVTAKSSTLDSAALPAVDLDIDAFLSDIEPDTPETPGDVR